MKKYTYPLPERCRIDSVTIRQTFGTDEDEAILAAENNGTDPKMELVSLSIVEVDGTPCRPGESGIETWPSKTRQVVKAYYDRLNDIAKAKLFDLIEAAEEKGTEVVDGRVRTRYEFPKGCSLQFVVLQEMMEVDERAASVKGRNASEEMIRRCIVSTSKGEGSPSLEELKDLDTKTRNILATYWAGMNFVDEDEIAPLAMAAEASQEAMQNEASDVSAETSASDSSANGSGSVVAPAAG